MPDVFISKKPKKKSSAPTVAEPKVSLKTNGPESIVPPDPSHPDHLEDLKGHTHNPFAAFSFYPHGVSFSEQEPDEKVILLVRRHPITNIPWILLVIVMAFAPLVLSSFPLLDFLPFRFQEVAILGWYLLDLVIFIQGFLTWFFTVNIITTKRVVDVDFENLIYRKITDAEITHIEDATVQMGSVIRTLFDYGDLIIQTAAEIPEVTFDAVPHPDRIGRILSELRMKVE
ncbi:MAG TPA: hypothetical protein VF185_02065 [Patescibacteria group bacterium]